jgi:hypothetical protein
VLIGIVIVAVNIAPMLAEGLVGSSDFRAYWAASRLLLEGRDPGDPLNMIEIERAHFDPGQEVAVMAWNPPTLWVIMLPLAWIPFSKARWIWFVLNLALMISSALILSSMALPQGRVAPPLIYCLLVFALPPVLSTLFMGQIISLVVFGITAALWLIQNDRWFWAGVVLVLTSVKPHLVVLLVPYLLIYAAIRRKWAVWLGLVAALAVCLVVVSALRPSWISDYFQPFIMPHVGWQTPTIGGIVVSVGAPPWLRFIGLGSLVLLPLLLSGSHPVSLMMATSVILLVSIPTALFGWSYDQSLLIIPIAQIVGWMFTTPDSKRRKWIVGVFVASVVVLNILQRATNPNDVYLFWVPLAWGFIYAWALVLLGGEDWTSFRMSIGAAVSGVRRRFRGQLSGSGG